MISELYIKNFKGISECHVKGLSAINIFIGKNDSCKSTIIEAASTTLKEGVEHALGKVISRRSNLSVGGRELVYGYDKTQEILSTVGFGSAFIQMSVKYDLNSDLMESKVTTLRDGLTAQSPEITNSYYGSNFQYRGQSGSGQLIDVFPDSQQRHVESYMRKSKFIDSSSRNDLKSIENLLGKVKLEGKDEDFGKFLFEIFGSGRKWEFMPHPDFPNEYKVTLIEGQNRVFLNGIGDGVRFGMLIIANSVLSYDTALFIEEIENNQHPESLKKLIPFLIDMSKKNNLQLFITTHNPMVWSCFEKTFETEDEKNTLLRVYHVKRDSKTGHVDCILQTKKDADGFFSNVHKDLYGA